MRILFQTASSEKSVEDAIRDLRRGHATPEEFRIIFNSYHARVVRMFERKGLEREDALDLAQEVFLAVYRSILDLRDEKQFQAWLFCIARNAFRNEVERRRTKKRFALQLSPPSGGDEQTDSVENRLQDPNEATDTLGRILNRERLDMLIAVMRELPGQMRRCLHLRVVEDNSYQEIATAMGLSINTVKAHLHQAKKVLREKLAPQFPNLEV